MGTPAEQLFGAQDPAGVVVFTPISGPASYPLRITGYARTFEANVISEVRQGGQRAAQTFGLASDYIEAWGTYELTITTGPAGAADLFVGEYSAADGSERGVHLPLTMR